MASWMVRRGAKTIGPFSTKVIQDKAREGQLLPADQVKQVGQLDWRAAASIRGLFSAGAIQQAASASPQGNNVLGEDIPEALPINNQGIDAVIPEALPADMPAPPPFQKKSVTGHTNTKRNLIIVSSSVGGIVLVTAIALIIIFNLPNSETDDIIPVESDEKTTVVVEDPLNPEADNIPTQESTTTTQPSNGSPKEFPETKKPLAADEMAQEFAGTWQRLGEEEENSDGTKTQREFDYSFTYAPTATAHGPFSFASRKVGTVRSNTQFTGTWEIIKPDGNSQGLGKYGFAVMLTYESGSEYIVDLYKKTNPRTVTEYDGKTMRMTDGVPSKEWVFTKK